MYREGQRLSTSGHIEELKRAITLVSRMFNALQVADEASPPADTPGSRHSPPGFNGTPTATKVSMDDISSAFDVSGAASSAVGPGATPPETSRKRCASTNGVDRRVTKAIKLEPQPDPLLYPSSSSHASMSAGTAGGPSSDPTGVAPIYPFAPSSTLVPLAPSPPDTPPEARMKAPQMPPYISARSMPTLHTVLPTGAGDLGAPQTPADATARPGGGGGWPERPAGLTHRHTLSGSSLNGAIDAMLLPHHHLPPPAPVQPPPFTSPGAFGPPPSLPLSAVPDLRPTQPGGPRPIRSLSVSHMHHAPFTFTVPPPSGGSSSSMALRASPEGGGVGAGLGERAHRRDSHPLAGSALSESDDEDDGSEENMGGGSPEGRTYASPPRGSRPGTSHDGGAGGGGSSSSARAAGRSRAEGSVGNEIPQEYKNEVDRIFFEFLAGVCSDLNMTDSKGELIHQALMAKKMQRLDESPDFRPFKFRIQAFTNSFLEELAKAGYPEEILPMKKVRYYLWHQPYISRYNEDGKKTKSKGNHIWSIDAKKQPDGTWTFRPFHRRLTGAPATVAYIGLRWSWAPKVWDPQTPRPNIPVEFSSPNLPSWLSWNDDVLSGTPPPDAESCEITVEARYTIDGEPETLKNSIHLTVAPTSALEGSGSSRRPSLTALPSDMGDPRRIVSDSMVPQSSAPSRTLSRVPSGILPHPPTQASSTDAQIMQVLSNAAQRVAEVKHEQEMAVGAAFSAPPGTAEIQSLDKQQHVLALTATVLHQVTTAPLTSTTTTTAAQQVAEAAREMVFQAAHTSLVQKQVDVTEQKLAGTMPFEAVADPVTVNEVTATTQNAVAKAVELTGPGVSEVTVLMTAKSLLQQQEQAIVQPLEQAMSGNLPPVSSLPYSTHLTPPAPMSDFVV